MGTLLRAVLFSTLFIMVDWMSFIHPMEHLNITPWNPPAALEVLFLYWAGFPGWLWVFGTICLSDVVVRDATLLTASVLVGNAVLTTCYACIALTFKHLLSSRERIYDRNQLLKLGLTMVVGSAVTACAYVGTQAWMGSVPKISTWEGIHRFFIGDLLGLFIVLPLVFVLTDRRRRSQYHQMFGSLRFWVLVVLLMLCLWFVFSLPIENQMKYFFSLFIILSLLAATYSLPGATLASALIQLPLVFSSSQSGVTPQLLMDMQIVMLSLSLTGLIIGMVVDERIMAEQQLRDGLQLIAAGELAGSLAHELHQPMSAISAYSESAMLMLDQDLRGGDHLTQVKSTLSKVVAETRRASEIVRGLRSYFIGGISHPTPHRVYELVDDCIDRVNSIYQNRQVQVIKAYSAPDHLVLVDAIQVKTAIGNLLKNAVEASVQGMAVTVGIEDLTDHQVSIQVRDQGDQLEDDVVNQIFRPFYTRKKDGLGLGLSVSKSLVEANGGVLHFRNHPAKCFEILLPIERSSV